MNNNRRLAYYYLLYRAFLSIRAVTWSAPDPVKGLKKVHDIADDYHNLAFFASQDFDKFDEKQFWRNVNEEKVRTIFDQKLTELNSMTILDTK